MHLIKATASHCGTYGDGIGWGMIRADQAVAAALDRDVDPPTLEGEEGEARAALGGWILKLQALMTARGQHELRRSCPPRASRRSSSSPRRTGGAYHRIGKTSKGKLPLPRASRGRRYRFFSIAVDNAGNREAAPAGADAKLK